MAFSYANFRKALRFTIKGRASRSEYWSFMGFSIGGFLALGFIAALLDYAGLGRVLAYAALLVYGAIVVLSVPVTVRRLHDRNHSGYWLLARILVDISVFVFGISTTSQNAGNLIHASLFYGLHITIFVWMCLGSDPEANDYGAPDPECVPGAPQSFSFNTKDSTGAQPVRDTKKNAVIILPPPAPEAKPEPKAAPKKTAEPEPAPKPNASSSADPYENGFFLTEDASPYLSRNAKPEPVSKQTEPPSLGAAPGKPKTAAQNASSPAVAVMPEEGTKAPQDVKKEALKGPSAPAPEKSAAPASDSGFRISPALLFIGIAILTVIGALYLCPKNDPEENTRTYYSRAQAPLPARTERPAQTANGYQQYPQNRLPLENAPAQNTPPEEPGFQYIRPAPGTQRPFYREEAAWCLREALSLEPLLNLPATPQGTQYLNKRYSAFEKLCPIDKIDEKTLDSIYDEIRPREEEFKKRAVYEFCSAYPCQ